MSKVRASAAIIAALAAGAAYGAGFPPVTDYSAPGPFTVTSKEEGPDCTVFRPDKLGDGGVKHPIILWGNGTRSRVPAYTPMLRQWASQGFVVAAANTNSAGSGKPILDCLDYLTAQNAADGSVFKGKLDLTKVGVSGHSQGGGGTIMAGRDPRITVTAPIEPYTVGLGYVKGAEAAQHGPMLLLSGGMDTTAVPETNQKPVFDAAKSPVIWATLKSASHAVPATETSGEFRPVTTAWFRWTLMDDLNAGKLFQGPNCDLCRSADWTLQRRGG
jgi:hypothetical protein